MTHLVEELDRYFGGGFPLAALAVLVSLVVAVGHLCRPRRTAVPGAPDYGMWFPAQFGELLANAHPPL